MVRRHQWWSSSPNHTQYEVPLGNVGRNQGDDREYDTPLMQIPRKQVEARAKSQSSTPPPEESLNRESSQQGLPSYKTPSATSSSFVGLFRTWWLELLCCFLVVGSLLAIVATVYPFQDQTLPSWPYGLSINSLVSIYVVILKATMFLILAQGLSQLKWMWFRQSRPLLDLAKYDDASRGFAGSIGLLWSFRGRHLVSSLGAFIMVAALAIDPMAQLIVHYYSCTTIMSGGNSTIVRTNYFEDPGGLHTGAGSSTLGTGSQSAINSGVFSATAMSLPFNCSTGNCTFPKTYKSVGYCSSCIDISDEVKTINVTYEVSTGHYNLTESTLNYTLPSGFYLSEWEGGAFAMGASAPTGLNATIEMVLNSTFGAVNCSEIQGSLPSDWNCRGTGAARCQFYPCVQEFSAEVVGGNLQETLVGSAAEWNITDDRQYFVTVDMECVNPAQKQALLDMGYQFDDTTRWLGYNVSASLLNSSAPSSASSALNYSTETLPIVPAECIYQYRRIYVSTLAGWVSDYFNGTVFNAPEEYRALPSSSEGSPTMLLQFYDTGNLTFDSVQKTFQNVTQSLTTYIRQNGVDGMSAPAMGVVNHSQTCVRVRWAWLTLPALLVLLTLIFFGAMITQTRSRSEASDHDFKSSALPLMFHGLELDTQYLYGGQMGRVAQMSEDAKEIYVKLCPTEKGWRFVQVRGDAGGG